MARQLLHADGLERGNVANLARQIYDWEKGRNFPRDWAPAYAKAFKLDPSELFSTGVVMEASSPYEPDHDHEEDEVKRRALLGLLATTAVAAPLGRDAEHLRATLTGTLTTEATERDADTWERVAFDYAHEVDQLPPAVVLRDLLADVAELDVLISRANDPVRGRLVNTAAHLAALTAYQLTGLGDPRAARRWWRTAAHAADASGDNATASHIRGKEAVLSLYTGRSELSSLDAAEKAIELNHGRPSAGVASANSARAQAYAQLGRHNEAEQALADLTRVFEHLPAKTKQDSITMWGWSEQRLHHVASYVHMHSGDVDRAQQAQDAAMARYPAESFLPRAQIELHRAGGLIKAGDTDSGAQHVMRILEELPAAHRLDAMIRRTAFTSLGLASSKDAKRPALRDAYAMLAGAR
ncbi:XRE family transcriptional regulator [Actinomadura sp. 6K520]|jgi:tetratricopeptide (TPR) repeat protein|uniref:XRE family transcriptional regulator n=1 Tax=Actinomadura sp. 6K520 TaxID=2530364 RepID=UPI00105070DC|nr:XRE family transcriptional regulator [Actinomadura sp. 6K520]TDE34995.1 XRE family transcriptional regulator [Actinomadura sp. 6K520]